MKTYSSVEVFAEGNWQNKNISG